MESLKDKIIWITGASRGIGAAIAEKLSETEAKLILSAKSRDSFKDLIKTLGMKTNVFLFPCDMSKTDEIQRVYEKILLSVGSPDVLINNAGVGVFKPFSELTLEDFDEMMNVNARGVFTAIRQVLPGMKENRNGAIINILSGAVLKAFKNSSAYSASKAALWQMSRCLREEVRGDGIKVIDIFPGATETDIWKEEIRQTRGERMMKPHDVADVIYHAVLQAQSPTAMVEEIHLKPQFGDL